MDKNKIEKIQKINSEIKSFRECYMGNELWGTRDGPVDPDVLIAYLIEHPEFQHIADKINKLDT